MTYSSTSSDTTIPRRPFCESTFPWRACGARTCGVRSVPRGAGSAARACSARIASARTHTSAHAHAHSQNLLDTVHAHRAARSCVHRRARAKRGRRGHGNRFRFELLSFFSSPHHFLRDCSAGSQRSSYHGRRQRVWWLHRRRAPFRRGRGRWGGFRCGQKGGQIAGAP